MAKASDQPVVLGVDPGLTRCGVGVVAGPAVAPTLVTYDCIRTASTLALSERLARVHAHIAGLIATHKPDVLAIEQVLFSVNVRTAMATGHAAGVVMLAAAQAGIPVATYTPTEVKLAVTGSGRADKTAMMRLVAQQFRLDTPPKPADAADALAIALTHLAQSRRSTHQPTAAKTRLADVECEAKQASQGGWEQHPLVRAQTNAQNTA